MLAFSLTVAIVLGLSGVMLSFTASAEDVSSDRVTLEDGTQVPTINGFSIIGSKSVTNIMVSYIRETYGDGLIFLIAQDKTTKDIYYARYPQAYLHDKECMYCYFPGGYDCAAPFVTSDTSVYDYFYIDDSYVAHHKDVGRSYKPSFYNSSAEAVSPNLSNLNYYWCYTNSIKWDKMNACSLSAIVGKSDNSGFKEGVTPGLSTSAKFVTCASFTREDGSLPLWFKDFTADGLQYPMFTYFISDNGNKHRYQMRLSYSSSQTDVVNTIFGLVNENNLSDQEKSLRELGQFLKGNLPVGSSNYTKFMALKPYMELILKKPEYISFDEAFSLNSNSMNFETSVSSGNKVYTICLSDYSDIVANYIYRAQLVDMQTSVILDTTYFCSNKTYYKGDSGTGAKIYDYGDDYNGMIEDIKNNTASVTPGIDNKFSTTGDIIDIQDNNYLSGLKIDNIFSVLGQSASSIGAFFQACLNIVPSAILSILLSTLSLLIVLRVLGR